ncbi:methionyl-tRNA formyltransferase [Bacteroidales bacterium OttesenSCG-928-C03]|nr:methionyl-tRNA formyltransferase [Bacteroidales bacterium OttesenSCG-928-C03]MDL2325942.1 methionyl-tRNA formyltransferase [Bacteroidales bacterium OttesenSCG-928-A14]
MRIVFMGTPEFAVATLEAIYNNGFDIAAVITTPDKPAGRGQKITSSEVKKFAMEHGLPVLQPEKLKDPDFLDQMRALNADLFVVVAFRMLPEALYNMPPLGTFNVHASLLPNYRGAAPIHHAVMNGEKTTGVTTFFLNNEIDKGDIIDNTEVEIGTEETTGELYERLKIEGAKLAIRTIRQIENGSVSLKKQNDIADNQIKLAPKIFKEDTIIDWDQTSSAIFNKIRGLSPHPGAITRLQNKEGETLILKCFKAKIVMQNPTAQPGIFTILPDKSLIVSTKDSQISLEIVQLQGKSRMDIKTFVSGFRKDNFINKLF